MQLKEKKHCQTCVLSEDSPLFSPDNAAGPSEGLLLRAVLFLEVVIEQGSIWALYM